MPCSVLCEFSHLESTVTEQPCAGDHPTLQMGKLRPTGTHLPEPGAWGGVGGFPGTQLCTLGRGHLTQADRLVPRESQHLGPSGAPTYLVAWANRKPCL